MTPSFVQHFDRCLGCLACVTACPSGVQYGPLIEKTRAQIEQRYERAPAIACSASLLMALVPYPRGCGSRCCRCSARRDRCGPIGRALGRPAAGAGEPADAADAS